MHSSWLHNSNYVVQSDIMCMCTHTQFDLTGRWDVSFPLSFLSPSMFKTPMKESTPQTTDPTVKRGRIGVNETWSQQHCLGKTKSQEHSSVCPGWSCSAYPFHYGDCNWVGLSTLIDEKEREVCLFMWANEGWNVRVFVQDATHPIKDTDMADFWLFFQISPRCLWWRGKSQKGAGRKQQMPWVAPE